jgi:hypothetical protein
MEQGFAFSFTPEEELKYPIKQNPKQLTLDLSGMLDYTPISKGQREAIVLIEKYTMHVFIGRDAADASEFIGAHMEESIAASRARGYNRNCRSYHSDHNYSASDEDDYFISWPDNDDCNDNLWVPGFGIHCANDIKSNCW